MKAHPTDDRGPAELLGEAAQRVSNLMRKEVDLARAEIDANITRAVAAVGALVAAIVFALTALHVLAAALVAALTELGIDAGWAALLVGVGFAGISFLLAITGLRNLSATSLAPTRTAENVQADIEMMKETSNA